MLEPVRDRESNAGADTCLPLDWSDLPCTKTRATTEVAPTFRDAICVPYPIIPTLENNKLLNPIYIIPQATYVSRQTTL